MTYTVVLLREDDGRYSVSVPALRGCHTWGYDVPHALEMVREAITGYIEVLEEDGEPIPPDNPHVALDMTGTAEAVVRKVVIEEAAAPA